MNTGTLIAVLAKHSVNMRSTTVSATIWKSIQDKTFILNVLSSVKFCIVMPTVTKSIFYLVTVNCTSFIIVCTSPNQ